MPQPSSVAEQPSHGYPKHHPPETAASGSRWLRKVACNTPGFVAQSKAPDISLVETSFARLPPCRAPVKGRRRWATSGMNYREKLTKEGLQALRVNQLQKLLDGTL
jgi:hypothetical protein